MSPTTPPAPANVLDRELAAAGRRVMFLESVMVAHAAVIDAQRQEAEARRMAAEGGCTSDEIAMAVRVMDRVRES